MSIAIMSHVWAHSEFESGALLVLLAMADHADDSGRCFPGVPQLAAKSRMTDRNVQLCLRKLEEAGEIKILRKGGIRDGKNYATVYKVFGGGEKFSPGGEIRDTKRVKPTSPQSSLEPSIIKSAALDRMVAEIYEAYPLKVGKPAALRSIIKALRTIDHKELLAKTVAFAQLRKDSILDIPRVPNPTTWFNQERYNDDPLTWAAASKNGSRRPGERPDESLESKIAWQEKKKRLQAAGLL